MSDTNEIKLSGTIHKLYRLKTKSGGPMTKILLKVGKDTFWTISYGNVAAAVGRLNEGDELSITALSEVKVMLCLSVKNAYSSSLASDQG